MKLEDQLGALELSLDELIQAATTPVDTESAGPAAQTEADVTRAESAVDEKPMLNVSRPDRDVIEMSIGGQSVLLNPEGVSRLIEELANARASMTVEQPGGLAPGWRFAATRNPAMATQKQSNGDRLLVLRHTGHGWVPFTFSPDTVIEMYAMLTKR
ncbi:MULTISPECIES: hypothetical protein [unclassified Caballeronia]|uniref:hypothetical protein n=1 Tax=unclassified Caballeronia TaxID=2646786 RepID=UPI0028658615|nr:MULTISPECIES: hypothetical protein [unclassified Caballeronia]MDR5754425.1 hypothetical protein [Caballeronia sp. LZ024]MDR5840803.1 hypothetical protein [Caballeronia sp. LZ031]